jgi:hypothetical protein
MFNTNCNVFKNLYRYFPCHFCHSFAPISCRKIFFLSLYLSFSAEFSAIWQQCLDQSGWSMAMGGKGEWTNYELPWGFSESYFTLEKHSRYREGISVQKSEDYKTLIWILLGEITFVIGPDFIFVNLWGACDSAVLQCITCNLPILLTRPASFRSLYCQICVLQVCWTY